MATEAPYAFKFGASLWLFARAGAHSIAGILGKAENKGQNIDERKKLKGIGLSESETLPNDLPSAVDIKRAIPNHCFQPTVATSMYYAIKDVVVVALLYVLIRYIHSVPSLPLFYVTLVLYWVVQGTYFTALFVIGHDCGHDSFSHSSLLNDIVGTITHTFLMVPFYMWKLSHRHHHKNTANIDKDEVFYPVRESDSSSDKKLLPGFGLGIGWFGYLVLGYSPRNVNHFNIQHPIFRNHLLGCSISLLADLTWGYCLFRYAYSYGFMALFNYYLVPLFIFASYTVIITFLHHCEMNIPWYSDRKWDFVRGQLSSVDRHYGIVHHVIHSIGTHQMHHMFSKIPHYHLEEATRHFRQSFPGLVKVCDEPIMTSFWRMFAKYIKQVIIHDDTDIHKYK